MRELHIASISGKGYELGVQFSKMFENINFDIEYYENLLNDDDIRKKFEIVKEKIRIRYPDYLEEMYGRADGFHIDRDLYLLSICFEIYSSREACTDVIIRVDDKQILFGHNEDLLENLDEIALIKYASDKDYYYDFSTYNFPQGTTFGWNSYGIVYSVNSIDLKANNEIGIPFGFILRDIVQCKSIEEIVRKINLEDCASAFSLNILDCNKNKVYSIEKVLDKLDIIEIKDKYVHTNHIIHSGIDKNLCYLYDSTLCRFNTGNKLLNGLDMNELNIDKVTDILQFDKNQNEYVFKTIGKDEYATVATFLFDSLSRKIKIYSYYDNKIIDFNDVFSDVK